MSAPHVSVLLDEVIDALQIAPQDHIIDGTFGAGGYTRAFLSAGARVTGFDRDPSARRFAADLPADRFELVCARFSEMGEVVGLGAADGVALDLGVSSMQLDEAERGFSFLRDGPLDMRMGDVGESAADLVNTAEPEDLARIFWVYGEEKKSRRIAGAIARRRANRLHRVLAFRDRVRLRHHGSEAEPEAGKNESGADHSVPLKDKSAQDAQF